MSDKVLVCRCEDVTLDEVVETIGQGYASIEEVKRMTGLGTGPCQGKDCMALCALLVAERLPEEEVEPFTARPLYAPTPLALFARKAAP